MKITVEQLSRALELLATYGPEDGLCCFDESHTEKYWSSFATIEDCATICAMCLLEKLKEASDE